MTTRITLDQFIGQKGSEDNSTPLELLDLLCALERSFLEIGALVARVDQSGDHGVNGLKNIHDDSQITLDVASHDIVIRQLGESHHLGLLLSEESEEVIETKHASNGSTVVVAIDPLDGSKETEVNAPVGSIFGIWRKKTSGAPTSQDFLQPGRALLAAGMAVYGPRLTFMYSSGKGLHVFSKDPDTGQLVLVKEAIMMPVLETRLLGSGPLRTAIEPK